MKKPVVKTWKTHVFEGVLLLVCTGFIFWYLTDFENSHDASRSINWVVALLYNFGGKWLVTAVTFLLTLAEFNAAWKKWRGV